MNKLLIILSLICCSAVLASGQIEDRVNLPDSEVEVIKDYRARIADARIIPIKATLPPLDTTTNLNYNYVIRPQSVEITYEAPQLKPVAMKKPNAPDHYPFNLKAGYGTQKSPYGRLHYHWSDDDQWDIHAYGLYQSSDNSASLQHQRFRDTELELKARRVLHNGAAIHGAVHMSRDEFNWYGYDHSLQEFGTAESRRNINSVGATIGIDNAFKTVLDIDYALHTEIRRTVDQDSISETYLRAQGGMHKWFNGKQRIGIDFEIERNSPSQNNLSGTTSILAQPQISAQFDRLKIKGGISSIYNGTDWALRPLVEAQYNLAGSQLLLLGGFTSTITNQHLLRTIEINPFINPIRNQLIATSRDVLQLGAEGNIKQYNYHLTASYAWLRDELLFVNDIEDGRFFNLIQDDGKRISVNAQLERTLFKTVRLATTINYNHYTMDNLESASHLPALNWTLTPSVGLFNNELKLELQTSIQAGIESLDVSDNTITTLPAIIDVSIGAEYYFSERLGAYAHLNNLANLKRQRWNNYPRLGFNAHAGILFRF